MINEMSASCSCRLWAGDIFAAADLCEILMQKEACVTARSLCHQPCATVLLCQTYGRPAWISQRPWLFSLCSAQSFVESTDPGHPRACGRPYRRLIPPNSFFPRCGSMQDPLVTRACRVLLQVLTLAHLSHLPCARQTPGCPSYVSSVS